MAWLNSIHSLEFASALLHSGRLSPGPHSAATPPDIPWVVFHPEYRNLRRPVAELGLLSGLGAAGAESESCWLCSAPNPEPGPVGGPYTCGSGLRYLGVEGAGDTGAGADCR